MTDMPQYIWAEKDELGGFWNTEEEYGESLDHMIKYIRADLVEKPVDAEVREAVEYFKKAIERCTDKPWAETYRHEINTLIRATTKNMGEK